jgi:hypothetical protein
MMVATLQKIPVVFGEEFAETGCISHFLKKKKKKKKLLFGTESGK